MKSDEICDVSSILSIGLDSIVTKSFFLLLQNNNNREKEISWRKSIKIGSYIDLSLIGSIFNESTN